jgi:AcrR family transcriptional regulator
MDKLNHLPGEDARASASTRRADGAQSRERLLAAAMRLFAEQGFAKTSTREIALAAGTNIASISYYFGDKAGLYRAAFAEQSPEREKRCFFTRPDAPLRELLADFYGAMLEPLKQGDVARMCMRLWYREMLEPTGLWDQEIDNGIKPAHAALVKYLARHLNVPDSPDLQRLAFSLVGLSIHLMVTREVIEKISPDLMNSESIDTWTARLVDFGEAMVVAEQNRLTRLTVSDNPEKPLP